ncbi:hypothetical protein D3C87_1211340 [compost metagenome]
MKILKFVISGTFLMSTALSPSVVYADAVKVVSEAETASQPKGIPASTTSGVNDNAGKAKDANAGGSKSSNMMGMALTAAGTVMIAVGTAKEDGGMIASGVVLVGMGMMSFAQSKADKKASNAAGITGDLSDAYNDTYDNSGGLVDTSAEAIAQDKAIQDLEKSGVYNPKKGTITAGGKTYKTSDFASKASMAAAGLPSGAIDGAMAFADKEGKKIAEKVKLGALTAANGYVEGGSSAGGGGGGPAFPSGADAYGSGAGTGGMGGSGATREPTNLAGMQKNYNGEPIGVSADSIFNMMTRRYKVKDSQESFYSDTDLSLKK